MAILALLAPTNVELGAPAGRWAHSCEAAHVRLEARSAQTAGYVMTLDGQLRPLETRRKRAWLWQMDRRRGGLERQWLAGSGGLGVVARSRVPERVELGRIGAGWSPTGGAKAGEITCLSRGSSPIWTS